MQWYPIVNRAVWVQARQTSVGFTTDALKSRHYKHGKLQFQIIFLPMQNKKTKHNELVYNSVSILTIHNTN